MTYCQRLSFSANRLADKQKADRFRLGWEDVVKKDLRRKRAFWESAQREALDRL